jgi:hypothetical protein
VTCQNTHSFTLEHIPYIDVVVFVAREQESPGAGKRDRCDTAEDVVIGVDVHLSVGAHVEQTAGSVVGSSCECVAVGEESEGAEGEISDRVYGLSSIDILDCIDVTFVSGESLHRFARSDIPYLCSRIARAGYEKVLVRGEGYAERISRLVYPPCWNNEDCSPHDISSVIAKLHRPDTSFNIPKHASHVSRTGHDLTIVDESTATEVSRMRAQFPRGFGDLTRRCA